MLVWKPAKQFAEILRRNGFGVWFDKNDLRPGERWMEALEFAIRNVSAMIVYIARLGVQAWWIERSASD
jgi:TIR domain